MELGALELDAKGLVAAITGAAVMNGAANSPCTDRGFTFDDKEAEAVAGRAPFHPGILGLVGAGRRSVSPEARKSTSPSKDEVRGSVSAQ